MPSTLLLPIPMIYLGLVASKDKHQPVVVTGTAQTAIQLGLTVTDNRANMFVCMPENNVRFCVNGTPNLSTPLGFLATSQLYLTMTRDEIYETQWIATGTGNNQLQIGSFVHQGFPQIY